MSDAVDFVHEEILDPVTNWASFGLFDDFDDFYEAPLRLLGDLIDIDVDIPEQAIQSRASSVRSSIATRELVYGRIRKGGALVYIGQTGSNSEYLHAVYLLANHSCELIEKVYLDDDLVAESNASLKQNDGSQLFTFENTPDYANDVEIVAQLGTTSTQSTYIANLATEEWNAETRGLGCCFVYLKLKSNRDLFRGVPNLSVLIQGKNDIYDPRDGSTGYSDNGALCVRDYMTLGDGFDIPESRLNLPSFESAIELADTEIPKFSGGPTEKRFAVAGVLKMDQPPLRNLEKLLECGVGDVTRSQGIWHFVPSSYVAPTETLTSDDLAGPVSYTPSVAKESRLNIIKGVYAGEESDWEATEYPEVRIAQYVADDGEELTKEVNHSMIASPYQAQRVGRYALEVSRFGSSLSAPFKRKALRLRPGQRVTLDFPEIDIDNAVFRVLKMTPTILGGINVSLKQDAASIYIDNPDDRTEVIAPPVVSLPSVVPVPPSEIEISEALYTINNGRDRKARITISWAALEDLRQSYDVQYRSSNDAIWIDIESSIRNNVVRINDADPGVFDFRVRAINEIGVLGEWQVIENYNIQGVFNPDLGAPINIGLSGQQLTWSMNNPPDNLDGFRVRYSETSADWDSATPLHVGIIGHSSYELPFVPTDQSYILIKAFDRSGLESPVVGDFQVNGNPAQDSNGTQVDVGVASITDGSQSLHGFIRSDADWNAFFDSDASAVNPSLPAGTSSASSFYGYELAGVYTDIGATNLIVLNLRNCPCARPFESISIRRSSSDPWTTVDYGTGTPFPVGADYQPDLQLVLNPGSQFSLTQNPSMEFLFVEKQEYLSVLTAGNSGGKLGFESAVMGSITRPSIQLEGTTYDIVAAHIDNGEFIFAIDLNGSSGPAEPIIVSLDGETYLSSDATQSIVGGVMSWIWTSTNTLVAGNIYCLESKTFSSEYIFEAAAPLTGFAGVPYYGIGRSGGFGPLNGLWITPDSQRGVLINGEEFVLDQVGSINSTSIIAVIADSPGNSLINLSMNGVEVMLATNEFGRLYNPIFGVNTTYSDVAAIHNYLVANVGNQVSVSVEQATAPVPAIDTIIRLGLNSATNSWEYRSDLNIGSIDDDQIVINGVAYGLSAMYLDKSVNPAEFVVEFANQRKSSP